MTFIGQLASIKRRDMNANLKNKKKQHTFTWRISNFSYLTQRKGECIDSPVFIANSLDETSWYLSLYPRGDESIEIDDGISCFLCRSKKCGGPYEISCDYKIEVFDASNRADFFTGSESFKKGSSWGSDISNIFKDCHSFDDVLTVKCHLTSKLKDPVLRSENIGLTKVDIDQCSFKWAVRKLNSDSMETMKFPSNGTSQVEITIQVPDDDIKIGIRRLGSIGLQYVMCRMTLLDMKGIKHDSKQATHLFEATKDNKSESDEWEFPTFLKKSKLNAERKKYMKDTFTLQCEISVTNGTMTSEIENKDRCDSEIMHIPRINNFAGLKEDLKQMYANKSQTDVEVIVDKKVFPAHKFILSARSPVFMAMFNQDMVENKSGQVHISDLEVKTLDSMLEFMYTGAVKEMDFGIASKLLLAADKYEISTLKQECVDFLISGFTDSNVCDVLTKADLIEEKTLRDAAVIFIKKHSKRILKSLEWKHFAEQNFALATDVFCELSSISAEENM